MSKKALVISGMLLLVVIAAAIGYISVKAKTNISIEAAVSTVLEQYNGEVLAASLVGQFYAIQLSTEKGLYEVKVRADGGGIHEIAELEHYVAENGGAVTAMPQPSEKPAEESTGKPQPSTKPTATPTGKPQPSAKPTEKPTEKPSRTSSSSSSTLISEKKAIELALAQVPGVVEEVELERSGKTRYYLVEIETAEGKEAQVQLNAASGKVMSITWGNDDEDDD